MRASPPASLFPPSLWLPNMKYKRILLKLSGEALAGDAGFGIDNTRVAEIAGEVAEIVRLGVQVGVVVGGGNFFRGVRASGTGLRRISVDYMGMLATGINAIALRDFIAAQEVEASVMSAIDMPPIAESFSPQEAIERLGQGAVIIFSAGTGSPYFSTDTAAALRAVEIEAEVVAKATKVDGVYDKDPVRFPDAQRYDKISYGDVLSQGLAVMDATAVSLCRENNLPVVVFNLDVRGNIRRMVSGEEIGTLIR